MKNSEIIEYINSYCSNNNELDTVFDADLVYTILAHEYLYVKPGIDTEYFFMDVFNALENGTVEGINMFIEESVGCCPLDECIRICLAEELLEDARVSFNNEYFEYQIKHLDPDEECDGNLLDKYLNLMNKEQLCDFFYNVYVAIACATRCSRMETLRLKSMTNFISVVERWILHFPRSIMILSDMCHIETSILTIWLII